jgi:hypothetical protein
MGVEESIFSMTLYSIFLFFRILLMYDFESSAVFISRLPMFFIKSSELSNSKINLLSLDDNDRIFNLDVLIFFN